MLEKVFFTSSCKIHESAKSQSSRNKHRCGDIKNRHASKRLVNFGTVYCFLEKSLHYICKPMFSINILNKEFKLQKYDQMLPEVNKNAFKYIFICKEAFIHPFLWQLWVMSANIRKNKCVYSLASTSCRCVYMQKVHQNYTVNMEFSLWGWMALVNHKKVIYQYKKKHLLQMQRHLNPHFRIKNL